MNARYWRLLAIFLSLLSGWQAALADERPATAISVALPADAELWINGRRTASAGALREFRDSQAEPGEVYRYGLRAVVKRDGREIVQQRLVRLAAGQSAHVEFKLWPNWAATTASKPALPSGDLLAQVDNPPRSRFQPGPADESDPPTLPALGEPTADGFRPREPVPTDSQPELPGANDPAAVPPLGDPADVGGFGRQFGEEPDVEPAPGESDLLPPEAPADPMDLDEPAAPPSDPVDEAASPAPAIWAAYVGHSHEHHLTGETGTALHIWNHAWRMVRLQRAASNSGPYIVYQELDRPGFVWAYGQSPVGCRDYRVFFKPGEGARWHFVGSAQRVRPFTH